MLVTAKNFWLRFGPQPKFCSNFVFLFCACRHTLREIMRIILDDSTSYSHS